jgi:glycosyltransferase involved in cell wall biosynthesis
LELSVVVPTRNELGNVSFLVEGLRQALTGIDYEIIFVDDSNDGTDLLIAALAAADDRLRLLHRERPSGGLAGAVALGLKLARGEYICVLDADLQHPPTTVPELLAEARKHSADLVVASRYVPGGSAAGLGGPVRRGLSRILRLLVRQLFSNRLGGVSDPLSGFFVVHRRVVSNCSLKATGYKILLEILVRCPWQTVREVPYRFEPRRFGVSKADLYQGLLFLEHLRRLILDRPRCREAGKESSTR